MLEVGSELLMEDVVGDENSELDADALVLMDRLLLIPTELEDEGGIIELLAEVDTRVDELGDSVDSGYGWICDEFEEVRERLPDELEEVVDPGYGSICVELVPVIGGMLDELEEIVDSGYG